MHVILATLIILGASALAIVGILVVRRRAPDGGYFTNGDRAAGVFGVLATGFTLLLGFVVFLAFTKYDESRAGSEAEALVLVQQFETAQLMPVEVRSRLSGELICYGRSVVGTEWPAMRSGRATEHINPWAVALFRSLETVQPGRPRASRAPTTRGWTTRAPGRRRGATGCMRPRASCPSRCGSCSTSRPR